MSQNRKESPSSPDKITSQDSLKRRPIHRSQSPKDKKDSSQKNNANNPELKECMDADYVEKDEVSVDGKPNIRDRSNEDITSNQNQSGVTESLKLCDFKTNYFLKGMFLVLIIFIFVTCIYSYVMNKSNGKKIHVTQLIDNMRIEFNDQSIHTFRILKSALKPVVNESLEPPAPAIIILLVNKNTVQTAWKFSEYLTQLLHPEEVFKIDNRIYGDFEPEKIKSNIDEKLKSLNTNSLNVIVVDDLEKVPFDAAMIFHSYCDHENARFKRAVYLFVVPSNKNVPAGAGSKHIDETAMERLRQIWPEAHTDLIESLITRLTGTIKYSQIIIDAGDTPNYY